MNKLTKKQLRDLERHKNKVKQQNNFSEAAKVCNCIGELLTSNGLHEEAISHHKEEIQLSEVCKDTIGVAVGNRKVGECLCELGRFNEAFVHQTLHLELSKNCNNLLEQQRALATIGRTHFMHVDHLESKDDVSKSYKQAEMAYLKSLEICNSLRQENISDKEILEMRARLYLNLGLVYEGKQDYNEALRYIHKALLISREQKLQDNLYRCQYTLSGTYLKSNDLQKALQASKHALTIVKVNSDKIGEVETLNQMAQIFLQLNELNSAYQTAKKAYKVSIKKNLPTEGVIIDVLKSAMKGKKLKDQLQTCDDKQTMMKLCEQMGDWHSDVKLPSLALEFYLQQLKLAENIGLQGKSIAPVYVSIALTYSDLDQHEMALQYYKKELSTRDGELKEKSATYCAIAKVLEDLQTPFEEVKLHYMKAIECAQGSSSKNAELKAFQDWYDYLCSEQIDNESVSDDDVSNVRSKLNYLKKELENNTEEASTEVECTESCSQLNDEELAMLESDSEDEDIEEQHLMDNTRTAARVLKKKVNKTNERGETPLHTASISGQLQKLKLLLEQGANVQARDYCGWQPLHEACNHGHTDIVQLLIAYGANVNDAGGQHCGGITPLHDASQNGHLAIVQLLVHNGATLSTKSKDGYTALDLVRKMIKAEEEEFSTSSSLLLEQRRKVETFLLESLKSTSKKTVMHKDRDAALFDYDESSDSDDDAMFPAKRAKFTDLPLSPCVATRVSMQQLQQTENLSAVIESPYCLDEPTFSFNDRLDDINNYCEADNYEEDLKNSLEKDNFFKKVLRCDSSNNTDKPLLIHDVNKRTIVNTSSVKNVNKKKNYKTIAGCNSSKQYQSRITYSRTPSPAFIDENNVELDGFIINDLPKKKTSRNHQSKIDFQKSISVSNNCRKKRISARQPNISKVSAHDTLISSGDDSLDGEVSHITNQISSHSTVNLFRIKVRVFEHLLLIPCAHSDSSTVGWLIDQVKERYHKISAVYIKLGLQTKDGALLTRDDLIGQVIMNNEELIAEALDIDFPPVHERYIENCEKYNQEPIDDFLYGLNTPNLVDRICINDVMLRKDLLLPIMESITFDSNISALDISNCLLTDDLFPIVTDNITLMPNLTYASFSCVSITTKGLKQLLTSVQNALTKDTHQIIKVPPLSKLVELDLSHNDFNDADAFTTTAVDLINSLRAIESLNLQCCSLASCVFDKQSAFFDAIRGSSIKHLNLSYNDVGDNLEVIVKHLQGVQISSLDLSSCVTRTSVLECNQVKNLNFLTDLSLNEVSLVPVNGLIDGLATSTVNTLSMQSLRDVTSSGIGKLCRSLGNIKYLNSLDLSYNKLLKFSSLDILLKSFKTNNSPIETLYIRGCMFENINFEHSEEFISVCETFGVKWKECNFKYINMSDSFVIDFEVDRLCEVWAVFHTPAMGVCDMERKNNFFVKFILHL